MISGTGIYNPRIRWYGNLKERLKQKEVPWRCWEWGTTLATYGVYGTIEDVLSIVSRCWHYLTEIDNWVRGELSVDAGVDVVTIKIWLVARVDPRLLFLG